MQKIYWSHGQLLARLVWTPKPTVNEFFSPRYTITWWSGQCQGPGVTTAQPHSQLAATTEVCYDNVMPYETLVSVFLWNAKSGTLIFNFKDPPLLGGKSHFMSWEKILCGLQNNSFTLICLI